MTEGMREVPFGDPFDPSAFFQFASRVGHTRALGMQFQSSGDRWAELSLPWREELVGVPAAGILASGAIVSLIDTASGLSVWIRRGSFIPLATIDLRIDYLRPATPGEKIVGRGECYRVTRKVGFVRGIAHNGNAADPVAHVTGTFMATGKN